MPRYLVTTRRDQRAQTMSARAAVASEKGVTLVDGDDPHMVTIDTTEEQAAGLASKLEKTHFVEPEIRRSLT
jgi:hypothetical protein